MKRTNLVLDGDLLEEARSLSGIKTYSDTVNEALREFCRNKKVERVYSLKGSGLLVSPESASGARGKNKEKKK